MSTIPPDARQLAFASLLPVAEITAAALQRVDRAVKDEKELTKELRKGWHPAQRAGSEGTSRFSNTVYFWGRALEAAESARRASSPSQEAQSIYLWRIGDRFYLRVKHDLESVVDPGAATLFSLIPHEAPVNVFLSWDVSPDGEIVNPHFASVDGDTWTIALFELLAALEDSVQPLPRPAPRLVARSRRRTAEDDGARLDPS